VPPSDSVQVLGITLSCEQHREALRRISASGLEGRVAVGRDCRDLGSETVL
jgi:cyclopropane fatty-acyl-phospholipid synthase-like methyltransferase